MNLSDIDNATKGKFETPQDGVFVELELSKVYPNPKQPRKEFINIEELAATIKEDGLLQPIVVVKDKDARYMVIAGERRYRACMHLELITIKAHIIIADDKKVQELALVENIQRDDLTDFEKAKYINTLWASGHYSSKKELAFTIGKSQSYLSKAFKTIKLCDEVISDIEANKLDIGLEILQELSSVKDKDTQLKLHLNKATREEIRYYQQSQSLLKEVGISPAKKEKFIYETETDCRILGYVWARLDKAMKDNDKTAKYKITIEEI